jgi:hypothetical protein
MTGALILGVIVLVAGVATFVTLNAFFPGKTSHSTVHSCVPPKAPQCTGSTNSTHVRLATEEPVSTTHR